MELSRKKTAPPWVILNTSSDCFQPHPDILEVTYDVIRILLDHHIGISFLTKGIVPQRFIQLFEPSREKILAQIGLVSLSDRYWREYEPNTPSPEKRLENIEKLMAIGILPEIRIDPIIPFVTDTESNMDSVLRRLKESGVKKVTLSYLHLRPAIHRQLMRELPPLHRKLIESCFRTQAWKEIGSSTRSKLLPASIRERGYQRIERLARGFGIAASICQCKNPDLRGDLCGTGTLRVDTRRKMAAQLPLFQC
jgi:DNA repair photolyase